MQINNLLKLEWRVCSHATAEPDKMHTGTVRAPSASPQCLPGWAEQAKLQEILWSGKSLGIQDQVSNVSLPVDKQWALILSQSSCNWNLWNAWHVYSPRQTRKQIYFTLHLIFIPKIASQTISIFLCINAGTQTSRILFIIYYYLSLFGNRKKTVPQLFVKWTISTRLINISEKVTWPSWWSIDYL